MGAKLVSRSRVAAEPNEEMYGMANVCMNKFIEIAGWNIVICHRCGAVQHTRGDARKRS